MLRLVCQTPARFQNVHNVRKLLKHIIQHHEYRHVNRTGNFVSISLLCSSSTDQLERTTDMSVTKEKKHSGLHNRVVDTHNVAKDNQLLNNKLQSLSEEDSFGTLTKFNDMKVKKGVRKSNYSSQNPDMKGENGTSPHGPEKLQRSGIPVGSEEVTKNSQEWSEVFGTLSDETDDLVRDSEIESVDRFSDDKELDEPYRRLSVEGRKHAPAHYGRKIEKLAKKGKIAEAVDVLEAEMLKKDRVMPNQYVFTTLIGCLGRVGYTKKAFSLFNKMKKMGLQPEDPTYTALFNACANSPFKVEALDKAKHLRQLMAGKGYQPNGLVYLGMMKAFGMCGDIQASFEILDEMIESGNAATDHCFRHLLIACISDKDAGFKHAIEVWRQMRKRKITPNGDTYNLLLRSARDCGAGDPEYVSQLLGVPQDRLSSGCSQNLIEDSRNRFTQKNLVGNYQSGNEPSQVSKEELPILEPLSTEVLSQVQPTPQLESNISASSSEEKNSLQVSWWNYEKPKSELNSQWIAAEYKTSETSLMKGLSVMDTLMPNILNPRGKLREVLALENLDSPVNRLALLGGAVGLLSHMVRDDATPDIRTFTLLLDCCPSNPVVEADLLASMANHEVKPDIDFLSLLIRKRNFRRDFAGAKDVLSLINHYELAPNMRTFACLAMGCLYEKHGRQLLHDMEEIGMLPSVEVFNTLMNRSRYDFHYKLFLCKQMKTLQIQPDEVTLRCIESQIATARRTIVDKEKGKDVPNFVRSEGFSKDFGKFMVYYKAWLLSMEVEIPPHPWAQFDKPTVQLESKP